MCKFITQKYMNYIKLTKVKYSQIATEKIS